MMRKLSLATLSIAALVCTSTPGSAQSYLDAASPTFKWNAGANLDGRLDNLDGFDDLDDTIRVRDLRLTGDVLWGLFGARMMLEEDNNQLKVDGTNLKNKLKELYVGFHSPSKMVYIYAGRKSILQNNSVTQRPINMNDPNYAANTQLERYMVASVVVDTSTIQLLNNLSRHLSLNSVEVSAFNSQRNESFDLGDIADVDSYAARVSARVGQVLTQVSRIEFDGGETRTAVSATAIPKIFGFSVYGEAQRIRQNPSEGNVNIYTAGVSRPVLRGNGSVELSRKTREGQKSQTLVGVGYSQPISPNISVGGEGVLNTSKASDSELWATMSVHTQDNARTSSDLFPQMSAQKRANDAALLNTPKRK